MCLTTKKLPFAPVFMNFPHWGDRYLRADPAHCQNTLTVPKIDWMQALFSLEYSTQLLCLFNWRDVWWDGSNRATHWANFVLRFPSFVNAQTYSNTLHNCCNRRVEGRQWNWRFFIQYDCVSPGIAYIYPQNLPHPNKSILFVLLLCSCREKPFYYSLWHHYVNKILAETADGMSVSTDENYISQEPFLYTLDVGRLLGIKAVTLFDKISMYACGNGDTQEFCSLQFCSLQNRANNTAWDISVAKATCQTQRRLPRANLIPGRSIGIFLYAQNR